MKLRSTTTFTAIILLLIATPVIFQRLGDLRRDAEDQMQAALMSVLLKFHGSQPREETTPRNGHRKINRTVTEICADNFPEKKTKKSVLAGKLISAKRGTGAAKSNFDVERVTALPSLEPSFVAVADIEAFADVPIVVQPVFRAALKHLPDVEAMREVAATAPQRSVLPTVPTKPASAQDLDVNKFSFAPMMSRQTRVLLKRAAELEKEMLQKAWWQDLVKNQRKISESVKAKLCAEAERKENEARAQKRESRRFVFQHDEQPFERAVSEE